jgi:radical SAM protein with 4Fe4S-binding SPASM domain
MMPNGDTYICCQDYGLRHKLGNLFEDTFEELFESEEYKEVVDGLQDDTKDIICRDCEWAQPQSIKLGMGFLDGR